MSPKSLSALVLVVLTSIAAGACGSNGGVTIEPGTQSSELEADLIQLREEEKLARDVYLTLHETTPRMVFEKIPQSEQRHMDHVKMLLDGFEIADPVVDDSVGVFTDPRMAALYTELTTLGQQSDLDAVLVGATIEDLDIFDIRVMRLRTDNAVVHDTYDKLECGSRNHIRAFTRELYSLGETYTATYISAAEYEEILEMEHETCGSGEGH